MGAPVFLRSASARRVLLIIIRSKQRLHFKPAYAFVPIARTITTSTRYRLFNFDQMLIYVVHEHYLWRRLL